MTRLIKLASALLVTLGIALGVTAGPASAHSYNHTIGVSGSMFLLDHETWSSNQSGWHHFNGSTFVGPWQTQNTYFTQACVGSEVRGELRVIVNDNTQYPGWAYATVDARLYEGTSCSTGDLDGHRTFGRWIARGQTTNFTFRVSNTAEGGGDYIDFNFNVSNYTS